MAPVLLPKKSALPLYWEERTSGFSVVGGLVGRQARLTSSELSTQGRAGDRSPSELLCPQLPKPSWLPGAMETAGNTKW